jgi:membrane carboxypeptidase/penicillin-binding protein PbpC
VFREREEVQVSLSIESADEVEEIEYFIDETRITTRRTDNSYIFTPKDKGILPGEHTLMVVVHTKNGARGGTSVNFTVR